MARPIVEAVKERIRENHPIAAAVVEGVQRAAGRSDTALQPADVPRVVEEVQNAIARDPVATSAVGAEPWYQNRVKVGLYLVGAGAVAKLVSPELGDWFARNADTISTVIIAFGAIVAAIGEWLAHWLAGIRWSRPWTIFGIGR